MNSNKNFGNVCRPIGIEINPIKYPTEGTDANGRTTQIIKDEFPTRIDIVSDTLYYLGWAELGTSDSDNGWKIRRIQQVGSVWEQKYAYGNQFYRYKWSDRSLLSYL